MAGSETRTAWRRLYLSFRFCIIAWLLLKALKLVRDDDPGVADLATAMGAVGRVMDGIMKGRNDET